jgi:hypothetical protein
MFPAHRLVYQVWLMVIIIIIPIDGTSFKMYL